MVRLSLEKVGTKGDSWVLGLCVSTSSCLVFGDVLIFSFLLFSPFSFLSLLLSVAVLLSCCPAVLPSAPNTNTNRKEMSKRSRPVGANRSLRAAPPAKKIKVSAREEQPPPPPKRNFLDEDQDDDNDALDLASSEDAGSEDEEVMTFDRVTPGEDELDAESSEEEKLEGEADLEEEEDDDDDDDEDDDEDEEEEDDDEEEEEQDEDEAEEGQQETEIKEEKQEDTPSDTTTTTTKTKSRQKAVFFVGGETSEPSDGRISQSIIDTSVSFASFNLDSRILKVSFLRLIIHHPSSIIHHSIVNQTRYQCRWPSHQKENDDKRQSSRWGIKTQPWSNRLRSHWRSKERISSREQEQDQEKRLLISFLSSRFSSNSKKTPLPLLRLHLRLI